MFFLLYSYVLVFLKLQYTSYIGPFTKAYLDTILSIDIWSCQLFKSIGCWKALYGYNASLISIDVIYKVLVVVMYIYTYIYIYIYTYAKL